MHESQDGSSLMLLSQSAPLVLSNNINAAGVKTVLTPLPNKKDKIVGYGRKIADMIDGGERKDYKEEIDEE